MADAAAHEWLFSNRAFKKLFGGEPGPFEVGRLQHDTDTGAVIFKGNDPEPTVQRAHHSRECAIDSSLAFQTFVVRKEREFLQMLITFLQLEFVCDHRIATARVDQIARTNLVEGTRFCASPDAQKRVPPKKKRHAAIIEHDIINESLF